MLYIDRDGNITLTRADTAFIDVTSFKNQVGETYQLFEGDKVYFRLKTNPILEKELTIDLLNNKAGLHIIPDDTAGLPFTTFKYEMELVTSTGEHFTFIADRNFTVGKEVEEHNGS